MYHKMKENEYFPKKYSNTERNHENEPKRAEGFNF